MEQLVNQISTDVIKVSFIWVMLWGMLYSVAARKPEGAAALVPVDRE